MRIFLTAFDALDVQRTGFVGPAEGRELLERSQLDTPVLSQIWRVADADGDGRLSRREFVYALHLVELFDQGLSLPATMPQELANALAASAGAAPSALDAALAAEAPPLGCPPAGCGCPIPPASYQTPTLGYAAPPSGASPWAVSPEEMEGYGAVFEGSAQPRDGGRVPAVPAAEMWELLARSQLPQAELEHIWQLSDVDGDRDMTFGELVCALHLTSRCRRGVPLPPALPPELVQAGTAADAARTPPLGVARLPPGTPTPGGGWNPTP